MAELWRFFCAIFGCKRLHEPAGGSMIEHHADGTKTHYVMGRCKRCGSCEFILQPHGGKD